jgi:apolipoprotein N-acyltransferase
VLHAEPALLEGTTPHARAGDAPLLVLSAAVVAGALLRRRRPARADRG